MQPHLSDDGRAAAEGARALPWTGTETSHTFPPSVIGQIHEMADVGRYEIRGWGAKRQLPTFDDLVFLSASLSRYPLEGYRERCSTATVLGTRYASKPMELAIPITIAGMSFGSLSAHAKEALGRAATAVGTSTTTGDGGMTDEERKASRKLVYQCLPSRYGFTLDHLRAADAIEVVVGQGAKPGGGGMLLGQKVSERVAGMRTLPAGIDQRSASRHPDWTGPDDLRIKIEELREATGWEKAGLREAGRHEGRARCQARRRRRCRRRRRGRDAGGHWCHPDRVHRARWHSHAAGRAYRCRGTSRYRHARSGSAGRFRRHPLGRRRSESPGARSHGGLDRRRLAGGSRLQPAPPTGWTARTTMRRRTTGRSALRLAIATTATPGCVRWA